MKVPFVTRSHHEEVVRLLEERLKAAEDESHRLHDLILKHNFGVQLFDSFPEKTTPEPVVQQEDPAEENEDQDVAQLRVIRRTRPSQLGPAMERLMQKRTMKAARAAHPTHMVQPATHPARELFAKARAEAEAVS